MRSPVWIDCWICCDCFGQLQAQLRALADKKWRHPIGGHGFTLGFSTIERWHQKASAAKAGPVEVLKRKIRSDQGQHPALSAALVRELTLRRGESTPHP